MVALYSGPCIVVSDESGNIFEIPEFPMVVLQKNIPKIPDPADLIPLPHGSDIFVLPSRRPITIDSEKKNHFVLKEYRGTNLLAAAAFMAPAYMQTHRCAYETDEGAPRLPLFSYTPVGWYKDQFVVPALRIDDDERQDLRNFNLKRIEKKAARIALKYPTNRLVQHIVSHCVMKYGCPAARNFVLNRWECPVPTSRMCNASCLGCISLQPKNSGLPASHDRLTFTPTIEEIVDFTVDHIESAPLPVISFGQGCEGEPLTNPELLEQSIIEIRKKTKKGIINLNTNASKPVWIEKLFCAGLDSIRVSMNSCQDLYYERYFRPHDYTFSEVVESLRVARQYHRWASINYFVFPGFTDHPAELSALKNVISDTKINMIQTRNLNIDPQWYIETMEIDHELEKSLGMNQWIQQIRLNFPWIKLGYFNPSKQSMLQKHFA